MLPFLFICCSFGIKRVELVFTRNSAVKTLFIIIIIIVIFFIFFNYSYSYSSSRDLLSLVVVVEILFIL